MAYVLGMVSTMMLQGVIFGVGMSLIGLASSDRVDDLVIVVGVLYLIGGTILWVAVFKILSVPVSEGTGKLGAVMKQLETVAPSGAFKVGAGWLIASPKQWVFVNTAVAVIYVADLAPIAAIGNFLVFTLLAQLAYLMVVLAYAAAKDRITPALDAVSDWIRERLRTIAISVFGVLGSLFLVAGIVTLN